MTRPVVLRRAARVEYDEAGDWYERCRPGYGAQFTAAAQRVFDLIAAHPRMHAVALRDIRRAVVPRFPYCVYYRERAKDVVGLSVFHTSRDPAIWQGRS